MNNATMGDRIKAHRKRLGMTQEQLAERMGVSAQAVSKWENNLSCPDISVLPELADVFGITVDELLGKDKAVHEAEVVEPDDHRVKSEFEWRWNSGKIGAILFAVYILTVGALLLLRSFFPVMDISWWTIVWTTALVYIGISGLIGHFSLFCLIMSLGGLYFLLSAYGVIKLELSWGIVVPAALLIWGISLLIDVFCGNKPWKWKKKMERHRESKTQHRDYSCEDGELNCELCFGEYRVAVATPLLRGGSIESSFGDFTVDFSACEAVAPNCELEVENSFGSLTLLVPEKFRVELQPDVSFAAMPEIKGAPSAQPQGVIRLNADLSFGSLQIRYI